jgi:predicted thioredoxin/glutaredoxin
MPQWTVYTRPGCSLCEQMLEDLAAALGVDEAARVLVVDIETDPELTRKYALSIPVLAADGEFVCAYRLDMERLAAYTSRDP